MGHWIAIGKVPSWNNVEQFTADLKPPANWRSDPRTTITTVMALADGRIIAECHASREEDVEKWLEKTHWELESLTKITHMAKVGEVWKFA